MLLVGVGAERFVFTAPHARALLLLELDFLAFLAVGDWQVAVHIDGLQLVSVAQIARLEGALVRRDDIWLLPVVSF